MAYPERLLLVGNMTQVVLFKPRKRTYSPGVDGREVFSITFLLDIHREACSPHWHWQPSFNPEENKRQPSRCYQGNQLKTGEK